MAFIRLREVESGNHVLVNTDQITRVSSYKNKVGGPVAAARVLNIEVAGSARAGGYVPVDNSGEFTPDEADDESVVRAFAAFLATSTRVR